MLGGAMRVVIMCPDPLKRDGRALSRTRLDRSASALEEAHALVDADANAEPSVVHGAHVESAAGVLTLTRTPLSAIVTFTTREISGPSPAWSTLLRTASLWPRSAPRRHARGSARRFGREVQNSTASPASLTAGAKRRHRIGRVVVAVPRPDRSRASRCCASADSRLFREPRSRALAGGVEEDGHDVVVDDGVDAGLLALPGTARGLEGAWARARAATRSCCWAAPTTRPDASIRIVQNTTAPRPSSRPRRAISRPSRGNGRARRSAPGRPRTATPHLLRHAHGGERRGNGVDALHPRRRAVARGGARPSTGPTVVGAGRSTRRRRRRPTAGRGWAASTPGRERRRE